MHRRTRITLLSIAAALVVLLLVAVLAVYLLLQPQRFTDLLRKQARQAGLTLVLSTPAEPTLWPQPALVLHGLTLSARNRPVLVAARARLVLPWHTLLGGPTAITLLELDAPRINLTQLGSVLAQMNQGKSGAPSLPHIGAGIRISHGSLVRSGHLVLDDIHLETGPLLPGHIFSLQLTANTPESKPATLALLMTPYERDDALVFDNIHLTANNIHDLGFVLDGKAVWHGGSDIRMSLHGTLMRSGQRNYAMTLSLDPAGKHAPFMFHLTLDGPGMQADVHLSPSRLATWWGKVSGEQTPTELPLPPLDGTVHAKEITLGGMHIEGLRITAGKAIATASSTPAPATSSAADL